MRKNILLILASLAIISHVSGQQITDQNWSSEEDFRKDEPIVKANIIWLENNPLATTTNDTKALTQFVLNWVSNTPYISVKYDEIFLAGLTNSKKYKFGEKFRVTYLFGKSFYVLENPKENNEANASARGIEAMVTVYNELKKIDPSVRNSLLEKYSRLVKKGKTQVFTRSQLSKL